MHTCMCNWVTMLYSRKLTEHRKPAIMEKIKIIIKLKKKVTFLGSKNKGTLNLIAAFLREARICFRAESECSTVSIRKGMDSLPERRRQYPCGFGTMTLLEGQEQQILCPN